MLRRWSRTGVLLLALAALTWLGADSSSVLAEIKPSNRAQTWEFTLPIRYFGGKTVDFDHGSSIDIHDDLGWGFGFGYNLSEHMNINFEFAWINANYGVEWASADTPGLTAKGTGELDASSSTVNFTYNFMPKTFTPYVSAGVGWNWVDSNIPLGPPQTGCWWDPWYGQVCTSFQDTLNESGFSYGFGLGIRFEPKESFFLRLGANDNWWDMGSYNSNADLWTYRFELGWKF